MIPKTLSGSRTGGRLTASQSTPPSPAPNLLHLSIAGCILNDLYREAAASGVALHGIRVSAAGGFDTANWISTGITYSVEISSNAPAHELTRLVDAVDEVAEIPRAVRAGATVRRTA